ncbi:MAG: ribonuclease R [Nitrospinae bacterium]|nr:ribonuclease R [Nitrospinota bacterium]
MSSPKDPLAEKLRSLLTAPLSMREILTRLKAPSEERSRYRKKIRDLVHSGVIVRLKGDLYGLPEEMNLVTGRVQGSADGFGFLIPDDKTQPDVFLSPRALSGAMNGDKVVARVESGRGAKPSGQVIRVLERAHTMVPGIYERARNAGYVVPFDQRLNQDILIPARESGGAKPGQAVVAEITEYPSGQRQLVGRVAKVLGEADDPSVEIQVIITQYNLRQEFPRAAEQEAKACPTPSEKDYRGRLDLRARPIVTIDGETAKDFDDAVEVERLDNGQYRLGVHIADVSHYVREGTTLDREALKRGTSVYFPGSVIPMLPFELSNDLCSLKPKVDRLTLSCVMTFDRHGEMTGYQVAESVIRSVERMTYTNVAAILEGKDQDLLARYGWLEKNFKLMAELAALLRHKRAMAGAIDFDLPEPEIILDVTGRPESIITAERNVAHKLIEEFMLAANRAVAGHFLKKNIPAIYRVHDEPDPLKLEAFIEFAGSLGLRVKKGEKMTPKRMQGILGEVKGKPEEKLVTHVLLRSMKQARYTVDNIGHFGLAFEHYTHFTSPIRRYPDLVVHRLLKELLRGPRRDEHWDTVLPSIAEQTSKTERTAEEAERDVVKLRQTQFMVDKVGEEYEGIISGVTAFGFFVELSEPPVEGLVRISSVADDYYRYDEAGHALIGQRRKKRFRLGDIVRVRVENVSVERRRIDLSLIEQAHKPSRKTARGGAAVERPAPRSGQRAGRPARSARPKSLKRRKKP